MPNFLTLPRPSAATAEEWKNWHRTNKTNYPVRYFLTQTFPKKYKALIKKLMTPFEKARLFFHYRFYNRCDVVKTGLSKQWHEFDERMLYANFQILVDFVELDCSFAARLDSDPTPPLWRRVCLGIEAWRSRELGLRYLNPHGQIEEDVEIQKAVDQTDHGHAVIRDLYVWWKDTRPNRRDPYDSQLWQDCHNSNKDAKGWDRVLPDDIEVKKTIIRAAKESADLEEFYKKEDQEKLELLIKYRGWLWC